MNLTNNLWHGHKTLGVKREAKRESGVLAACQKTIGRTVATSVITLLRLIQMSHESSTCIRTADRRTHP